MLSPVELMIRNENLLPLMLKSLKICREKRTDIHLDFGHITSP